MYIFMYNMFMYNMFMYNICFPIQYEFSIELKLQLGQLGQLRQLGQLGQLGQFSTVSHTGAVDIYNGGQF